MGGGTVARFEAARAMNDARQYHVLIKLQDGKVLAAGGHDGVNIFWPTGEVYDSAADSWTRVSGNMAVGREAPAASLLTNGKVLVTGGWNGTAASNTADLYEPQNNRWVAAAPMAARLKLIAPLRMVFFSDV